MKAKTAVRTLATVIMMAMLFVNTAHALATSATIHLRLQVVGTLALNIEDGLLDQNIGKPQAEAFSELARQDISIERLQRNNSTVWRFTKTK